MYGFRILIYFIILPQGRQIIDCRLKSRDFRKRRIFLEVSSHAELRWRLLKMRR